jgi:hypothetical protein
MADKFVIGINTMCGLYAVVDDGWSLIDDGGRPFTSMQDAMECLWKWYPECEILNWHSQDTRRIPMSKRPLDARTTEALLEAAQDISDAHRLYGPSDPMHVSRTPLIEVALLKLERAITLARGGELD